MKIKPLSCTKVRDNIKSVIRLLGVSVCLILMGTSQMRAQNRGDEVINLGSRTVTLSELFRQIESQTDYLVVFSDDEIDVNRRINIGTGNGKVSDLIGAAFAGTSVNYIIDNAYIVLTTRPGAGTTQAQPISLTGYVRDSGGAALAGVSIVIRGQNRGAATNLDGSYSISARLGDILEVSYLGYETRNVNVTGTPLNIVLRESEMVIDDVVVTALGIKRAEKALSYNVQQLSSEELTAVKDANFMNSLIGKVAGASISSGASGPGSSMKVVMRGTKSISKNNNAVYVIDGIPMFNSSFGTSEGAYSAQVGSEAAADINPEDIESISVLTGPSAAALYGSEAANGAVIIVTKKGLADRTSLTISNNTTFSSPLVMPRFQNKYGNIQGEPGSWGGETDYNYDPSGFFNTGSTVTNAVSLATGSQKNQTYLSVASTNSRGILPNNRYDRYNFTYRNTTNFLDNKFVLDAGVNLILQTDRNMVSQGLYFNPLPALYLFPRGEDFGEVQIYERYNAGREINVQYWPYGDQGLSLQNPYWIMNRMNYQTNKKRYAAFANLQYNITDWLNVTGRAKIDNSYYVVTDSRYAGTLSVLAGRNGFFSKQNRLETQFYGDLLVNINKDFGDFNLHANIGGSIKDLRMDSELQQGHLRLANIFSTENMIRPSNYKADAEGYKEQIQSVFGNIELGWRSMLYLTVTGRNDWASQLAFSRKSNFFYPSVGLSALISEMLDLPSWFTYAKARVSYSSVGAPFDRYLTQLYYEYNEQTNSYDAPDKFPVYDFLPERTNSFEAGINLRFFGNKLNLDLTYYRSNTYNQTFNAGGNGQIGGYTFIPIQAGNVQNSGVEVALGFHDTWGSFSWDTGLTYSHNNNKIIELAENFRNPVSGETESISAMNMSTLGDTGAPIVRVSVGGSMGDLYVNRALQRDANGNIYLDSSSGLPKMVDVPYKKLGSLFAHSNLGWKNSFSWKGFNLDVLISARLGGLVVSGTQAVLDRYGVSEYSAKLREEGLNINGNPVDVRGYLGVIAQGTGVGAHYVYSATNVRVQEVSLGYTLPLNIFANQQSRLTLSLIGRNLFMIYNKAPFDPELAASTTSTFYTGVDYFMQPSLRNIGFSVKLQF